MAVQIAGSINVDLIQTVRALPAPGETVMALTSTRLPGGKGANQAVAAARMGAQTRFIGAVGADEDGRWMLGLMEEEGIDTSGILSLENRPTGLALIAVDAQGENQIIVNSGANANLSSEQTAAASGDAGVRLAQLESPVEALHAFFASPAAQNSIRILNTAPAIPEAASLFEHVDILIANQHELAQYLNLETAPELPEEALIADRLITRPDQAVIVTLGSRGAMAVWKNRHFYAPAFSVSPFDTIGAGDCFCGALAAALDSGAKLEEALPLANAAAALCTQKQGAIPSMPYRKDVQELLDSRA